MSRCSRSSFPLDGGIRLTARILGVLKMDDLPNRNTHTLQMIAAKEHSIPHYDAICDEQLKQPYSPNQWVRGMSQ